MQTLPALLQLWRSLWGKRSWQQGARSERGALAEKQAITYLQKQGLILIRRNYRRKWGEIDAIMQDQGNLVFVEVKARQGKGFGGPIASITRQKQEKIIYTARRFLADNKVKLPCRFDLVLIEGEQIEWRKNAFSANH